MDEYVCDACINKQARDKDMQEKGIYKDDDGNYWAKCERCPVDRRLKSVR